MLSNRRTRSLVVLLFAAAATFGSYHYGAAACFEKKCKDITYWGTVLAGVDTCFKWKDPDCVKCILYWCEEPDNTLNPTCKQDLTTPLKYWDCTGSSCNLKCRSDTTGDQEAGSCTTTGNEQNAGTNRFKCVPNAGPTSP